MTVYNNYAGLQVAGIDSKYTRIIVCHCSSRCTFRPSLVYLSGVTDPWFPSYITAFWPEHKGIINDTCNGNTAPIHEALVAFDWLVTRPIKHLCTDSVRHLPDLPPLRPYGSESRPRHGRDDVRGVVRRLLSSAPPCPVPMTTASQPPSSHHHPAWRHVLAAASDVPHRQCVTKTEPSYA